MMVLNIAGVVVSSFIFLYWLYNTVSFLNDVKNDPKIEEDSYEEEPENSPLVSVIIPVRNEENNIAKCLNSLINQTYENIEIIILNDCSTDNTEKIARDISKNDKRIKVINGKELEPKWMGKNFALHQGVAHAKGDWFLFIDADTTHSKHSIKQCLIHAQKNKVDMLTLFGRQKAVSFWERVVQPVIAMLNVLEYRFKEVNSQNNQKATANGQYLMIKKTAYKKSGGYSAIRDKILDDIEMAKLLKRKRFKIHVAWTSTLLETRMYTKFKDIWKGYSKNYVAAFENNLIESIVGLIFFTFGYAFPFYAVIHSMILVIFKGMAENPIFPAIIFGLNSLTIIMIQIVREKVCSLFNMRGSYILYQPLSTIFMTILGLNCVLKSIFAGSVTWKGRTYKNV